MTEIKRDKLAATVEILAGPHRILAFVTREAVDEMGLRPGMQAVATVKATNVAGDGVPGNADTTDQDFALVAYNVNAGTPPGPTIGVNPGSLSFAGTAGGANPPNQTLDVTNTGGGGALAWTATDSATWLSVSPGSGSTPSTLTVSVASAGLAAKTDAAVSTSP